MSMPVFISIAADDGGVMEAGIYQADAYNKFMNDKDDPVSKTFTYTTKSSNANVYSGTTTDIVVNLVKFDKSGLTGKYPTFCTLENEKGQMHILSNDKDALSSFHGFRARLMCYGTPRKPRGHPVNPHCALCVF
jgi:hypothetical protein